MKTGENFRIVCTLTTEIDGDGGVGGGSVKKDDLTNSLCNTTQDGPGTEGV